MTTQAQSGRRYLIRFLSAAALYTVLMFASIPLSEAQPEGSILRYVLASMPVIGLVLAAWAMWKYVQEADEFQARKLLDALAISLAGTLLIVFVIGMIQMAGGPQLSWVWVIPVWALFLAVGGVVAGRKYR